MKHPILSVIVPVWGVEKYIEKCARSLFESTLEDIEFIFVDDCTPDNSISILERVLNEYPNRKNQVKIVRHDENKGLPQARKTGYELSTGDWITYCDSDDWVDKKMYSKMIRKATECKYEMLCCDFIFLSDHETIWAPKYNDNNNENKLRMDLIEGNVSNAVWNKIVHRKVYHNNEINFPILAMDEDDVLTVQMAYNSSKIGFIHECLYYHYANPDSMTHQRSMDKVIKGINDQIENRKWIIDFLESKNDETLAKAIFRYKKSVKMLMLRRGDQTNDVRETYSEINCKMFLGKGMTLKERLVNLVYLYLPAIYSIYKKIR